MKQGPGKASKAKGGDPGPKARPPQRSIQPTDILVVSANLEELHDPADRARTEDMQAFANRVAELLPRPPDVLLLQEVLADGAKAVTSYLKQTTGIGYTVAVAPAFKSPMKQSTLEDQVRDTAILLNQQTMSGNQRKGFLATRYAVSEKSPGFPRARAKDHAHALATHRPSGTRLGLMSVHLAPHKQFASKDRHRQRSADWVRELVAEMKRRYPRRGRQINILAGDFNNPRSTGDKEVIDGEVTPFWSALSQLGYTDAIFEIHGHSNRSIKNQHRKGDRQAARIDYIFVAGGEVIQATHDLDPPEKGTPGYYADHRLVWAAIRPPGRGPKKSS